MATGYYLQDNPNPNAGQYGWPRNRVSGVVGIHTAENNTCFNGPDPGDADAARFMAGRSDFGSYHVLCDADSITPLVHPSWAAWADTTNNAHAMSVSAAVAASDWLAMEVNRRRQVVINMAAAAAELVQTVVRDGLLDSPRPPARPPRGGHRRIPCWLLRPRRNQSQHPVRPGQGLRPEPVPDDLRRLYRRRHCNRRQYQPRITHHNARGGLSYGTY